jgi:hypothetical protein
MPSPEHESLTSSLAAKTDPSTAARDFTKPTKENLAAGASDADIEACLSRAWNSVIDVAVDTQHESQESLVDIVRAVQQTDDADANTCTIWGEKVKLWRDMPLLGPTLREAWNRGRQFREL